MPVLDNPRHEKFAQGIAMGMTQDAAYAEAGFPKPTRQAASRLFTNDDIKVRVKELTTTTAKEVQKEMVYSARTMFDRLSAIVTAAMAEGDYKTAGDNQRYLLKCMGYEDMPTLTHEHLRTGHSLSSGTPAPGEPAKPRFAHIAEIIKKELEKRKNMQ